MPDFSFLRRFLFFVFLICSFTIWSQSPVELYQSGLESQNAGNYYKAIEFYRTALEKNPNYISALKGMGEAFFSLGEYSDALIFIEKGLVLDKSNYYLQSLKGRILIGLQQFEEAKSVFNAVLEQVPNQIDAKFGLAELDVAHGKVKNAIGRFEEALKKLPDNRRALLSLVLLYDALDEASVSEDYIKVALRYHPAEPSVRYVAGRHYLALKQYEEAEYHVTLSLNLHPGDEKTLLLLSRIYLEQQKYTQTIELLESMVSKQRDNPQLWYTLGITYGHVNRIDDAIIALNRVFRLQSDNEMARIALEDILTKGTDLEDEMRIDAADFHFEKAASLEEKHLLNQALYEYRRGLLLYPYSIKGRLGYAKLFRTKGFPAKYLSELEILEREGAADIDILDELEIQKSMQSDNLSKRWNIDQFNVIPKTFSVLIAFDPEISSGIHFNAEGILARYIAAASTGVSNLTVFEDSAFAGDFSQTFRNAREADCDYFIIFAIVEKERSFALQGNVYLSTTGRMLDSFSVYRTGNDRIANSARRVTEYLQGLFPLKGTLLTRKFGEGIVDFGSYYGVMPEDEFLIVRQDHVSLNKEKIGLVWNEKDVLGTFIVDETDEFICKGKVRKKDFFDMINPGDLVIRVDQEENQTPKDAVPQDTLYRDILSVP